MKIDEQVIQRYNDLMELIGNDVSRNFEFLFSFLIHLEEMEWDKLLMDELGEIAKGQIPANAFELIEYAVYRV